MGCYFYRVAMKILLKGGHLSRDRKEGREQMGVGVCLGEEGSIMDLRWECVWCATGLAGRPGSWSREVVNGRG